MTIDELKKKYERLRDESTNAGKNAYKYSVKCRKERNYPAANAWLQRSYDYRLKAECYESFLYDLENVINNVNVNIIL